MSATIHPVGGDGQANMQAKLKNIYQASKPDIRIHVNEKRNTYTTFDQLTGTVSITAPHDMSFDDIDIEFVGTSKTYVERLTTAAAISGRSEAFHQFLKLSQPGLHQSYPTEKLLRAHRTYTFSFEFVIPDRLLPRICQHKVAHPSLRDAHTLLPPTFGDRDSANKDATEEDSLNDMVPDMASIRYGVFARISKNKEQDYEIVRTTIGSKAKRIRVIPAVDEEPPLDVSGQSEYTLRKERTLRKGVLKGKLGTLVMEATQPPSLRMRARRHSESETCMAKIMLRFDPTSEACTKPPKIGNLGTKLKVCTYFASTARSTSPTKQTAILDLSQGIHTEQLQLSSRCMQQAVWQEHWDSDRRDSACSTTDPIPKPSATFKGGKYFTAILKVPISLPNNKAFVPTFQSCLISRVYQLKLELGLQTAGFGTMDLKLPFQISCQGSNGQLSPRRGSVESVLGQDISDDEELSAYFEGRTIGIPEAQFQGRSRIGSLAPQLPIHDDAPPGYSYQAPPINTGSQRVPVY